MDKKTMKTHNNGANLPASPDLNRAVLYARVSGDDTKNDGRNLQGQLSMCQDYALSKGYHVVAKLAEDDKKFTSGADTELPELNKMLELAEKGRFDVLVVREIDRLARNRLKQLLVEKRLEDSGVRIEYVIGQYDDTDEGQFLKGMMSELAEYERKKINQRMVRGKRNKIEAGNIIIYGRPPYGYFPVKDAYGNTELQVDDFEGNLIQLMFEWYATGVSMCKIVEKLEELKAPAPGDGRQRSKPNLKGKWYVSSVRRLLASEVYIGVWHWRKYKNKKRDCLKIDVPPIVDKDLWDMAQEKLEQNRIKRPQKYEYLLTSHLRCGLCHSAGHGSTHIQGKKKYRYYRCSRRHPNINRRGQPSCEMSNTRVELVDGALWNWLRDILSNQQRLEKSIKEYQAKQDEIDVPIKRELEIVNTLLAEHKEKYDRLIDLYLSSDIDKQYLEDKKVTLEQTINELTDKRGKLEKRLQTDRLTADDIDRILAMAEKIADNVDKIDREKDFNGKRWLVDALSTEVVLTVEKGKKILLVTCYFGEATLGLATPTTDYKRD